MTLQEIEDAIVAQAEKRRAEGWTIVSGTYGNPDNKTCCPLASFDGVLRWARSAGHNLPLILGMVEKEFIQVRRGVDGFEECDRDAHYLLGVRVRDRLGL
jgi:hypothetical protein